MVAEQLSVAADGPDLHLLEDDNLLAQARRGSADAFAALYDRHVYAARRLARHLDQREDSDDVVAEAFARILDLLGRGKGPERAFRAYLFTSIRHEAIRRSKAVQRVRPTDETGTLDRAVPFVQGLDTFEQSSIRAAYESLPDRWRLALWHLDVEGRKPHELADLMDVTPNSVSALVYRARAGLRVAYLQQHVGPSGPSGSSTCDDVRGRLAAVVRRSAPMRDQETVHVHLGSCDACMGAYLELREVNRSVG